MRPLGARLTAMRAGFMPWPMSEAEARIKSAIDQTPVILFMKGTRQQPQCGFSATVVQILDSLISDYETVNVLADPEIRQGIKDLSRWPTIPQLYIKGEFVGGCDIVKDLFEQGELHARLGLETEPLPLPEVSVSPAARKALESAVGPGEHVRLEVDARFQHALTIGERNPRDLALDLDGLTLLVDPASARRASGVSIDFVETPRGKAFKIENPNQPPSVRQISARELKQHLDQGKASELFDVRTGAERDRARIEGARLLDRAAQDHIQTLSRETALYFHCHHGPRSQQAAEFFLNQGFKEVYNLEGGIDAWSVDVDPEVPRY